jgi:nitrite reductase/ring-hydroxylating ferredoxin subunit
MATTQSDTTPYWSTSTTFPQYAKLADDTDTDVVVVGAGITGLTAAYLLAKAGKRVIVLECGFDPGRKALTRGLWDYVKEYVDYPCYLIRDRFAGTDAKSLRAVKRGEGKVIERQGAKVAAYRDTAGTVTLRSAICTHMGCTVGWNTAERTWDSPCHGSRFKQSGDAISGPAGAPLPEAT